VHGQRWPVFRDEHGYYRLEFTWDYQTHRHLALVPIPVPSTGLVQLGIMPTWRLREGG
jgi:hypothetical protein